ncbi:MAG: PD-(D/E)XK nuclease family protein, partial [Terrimicrobiaceae bacterium]
TADKWRAKFDTAKSLKNLPAFLANLYADGSVLPAEAPALSALGEILRGLLDSPLHDGETDEELFAAETQTTAVYGPHDESAVELNGWLEAPWLPHEALVLSGCTEGALPANVIGHPFLPDSLRVVLGLAGNARRFSRDAYLLHCLLACRDPEQVRITLSRIGAEGEPARPSRLLFRCPEEDLPARVGKLFGPAPTLRVAHARERAWLLDVPRIAPPTKLRVTSFGDYLDCPLRFYFKRILKMETLDAQKSEMDALDFGSALHLAIEDFSQDAVVRDSRDPDEITRYVHTALDRVLLSLFGPKWSLPVRVQRESLRARLRKFGELQAAERAAGWRIVEAEVPFQAGETLTLGGLAITGQIDRVEVHEQTGVRRILDYKTYKSAKKHRPEETHFGKSDGEKELPEAEFDLEDKPRRWLQLQLPLYRALARHRWPDDPVPAVAGYFLLPEKIEESGVFEFAMDDDLFESAMQCAAAVADRVRRGVFWPPREPQFEGFEEIFLGQDPGTLLTPKAIDFLKGS